MNIKCIIETRKDIIKTKDGAIFINIRAYLDNKREYGVERMLIESELQSHFQVIWDCLGKQLQRTMQDNGEK